PRRAECELGAVAGRGRCPHRVTQARVVPYRGSGGRGLQVHSLAPAGEAVDDRLHRRQVAAVDGHLADERAGGDVDEHLFTVETGAARGEIEIQAVDLTAEIRLGILREGVFLQVTRQVFRAHGRGVHAQEE